MMTKQSNIKKTEQRTASKHRKLPSAYFINEYCYFIYKITTNVCIFAYFMCDDALIFLPFNVSFKVNSSLLSLPHRRAISDLLKYFLSSADILPCMYAFVFEVTYACRGGISSLIFYYYFRFRVGCLQCAAYTNCGYEHVNKKTLCADCLLPPPFYTLNAFTNAFE